MNWRRARLAAFVAALSPLSAHTVLASTPGDKPIVSVTVGTDRMVFYDGIYRAAFSIVCPGDQQQTCPHASASDAVDTSDSSVRKAILGFDVTRASQQVDPVPLGAGEHTTSLHVVLHEPGDLTVRLSGLPAPGVAPAPVPGSASSGGVIEDRSVTWRVSGAQPGTFDFSARFLPGRSDPGPAGTFVPEARVELSRVSSTLLAFSGGNVPASSPVTRISSLKMSQRVPPVSGTPSMSVTPFRSSLGSDGLPDAWEVSGSVDAFGAYAALASGDRTEKEFGYYEEIAPGAGNVGANIMTTWHGIGQQGKATPQTGVEIVGGQLVGLSYSMRIQGPRLGAPYGDQLWDGDAVTSSGVAGVYSPSKIRTGPPNNDQGTVEPAWDGALPQGWSGLWADDLEGVSHDAGTHVAGANINWIARDGDIDNRSGVSARPGTAQIVEVPADQKIKSYLAVTTHFPETRFATAATMTSNRLTIRPSVGAGGYWLQSSGSGYERDWTNNTFIMIISEEEGGGFGREPAVAGTTVVPEGMHAAVTLGDASGTRRIQVVGPGAWNINISGGTFEIARLRPAS